MPNAELRAQLSCDNKPFINSMNQAVSKSKQAGATIGSAFKALGPGLGAALSVGAISAAAKSVGSFASEIHDMADTLNMSTDAFQQYSFAVSQSGGSQEVFVKGMSALIQKMEDVANNNKAAAESFAALGISASEIASMKPQEMFLRISDAIATAKDQQKAFSAAADIFGSKIALRLIASLKGGSEAFKELANSASIANKNSIDLAEAAQDRWDGFLVNLKANLVNAVGEFMKFDQAMTDWERKYLSFLSHRTDDDILGLSNKHSEDNAFDMKRDAVAASSNVITEVQTEEENKAIVDERTKLEKLSLDISEERRNITRDSMNDEQQINDLIEERAKIAARIGFYNRTQEVEMAEDQLQILKLTRDIEERKRRLPAKETAAMQAAAAAAGMHSMGGEFGGSRLLIGQSTLTANAHHLVRRGDEARRKAAADAEKKKDQVQGAIAENTAVLAEAWGAKGRRE